MIFFLLIAVNLMAGIFNCLVFLKAYQQDEIKVGNSDIIILLMLFILGLILFPACLLMWVYQISQGEEISKDWKITCLINKLIKQETKNDG